MNAYIELECSDASNHRHFKTLFMDASWIEGRSQECQRTATGKLDIQEGAPGQRWSFIIRCSYSISDDPWGDLLDLEYFASLNEPGATPSNILTMTDHFGVTHHVVISG